MSPFFKNIFLILGTTVGAGIFSLPLALSQAGLIYFFIFLIVLTFFNIKINYFYSQIVEHTKEKHQLSGYAKQIIGEKWAGITAVLLISSVLGALVAYLILLGIFISNIAPVTSQTGSFIAIGFISVLFLFGNKHLEEIDVFFTIGKLIILGLVIFLGLTQTVQHMPVIPLIAKDNLWLAYGTIMFSLTGFSIIPELDKDNHTKTSISLAGVTAAVLYSLFAMLLFVFIDNGTFFIPDPGINGIFNVAGILAVITPYIMLSWVAYEMFIKDLKLQHTLALALTIVVPPLFFLAGANNFVQVLSLTGGVFTGSTLLLIAVMYRKKFPHKEKLLLPIMIVTFILGIILEIVHLLN